VNTIHLHNKAIWAEPSHDPYNRIGAHVRMDHRRTKYINRCRIKDSIEFVQIQPIEPQPTRIQEVIDE
jgi:hypothetical protein